MKATMIAKRAMPAIPPPMEPMIAPVPMPEAGATAADEAEEAAFEVVEARLRVRVGVGVGVGVITGGREEEVDVVEEEDLLLLELLLEEELLELLELELELDELLSFVELLELDFGSGVGDTRGGTGSVILSSFGSSARAKALARRLCSAARLYISSTFIVGEGEKECTGWVVKERR